MPALASLKRFAASRNGKLVLGGTAVTGVVAAGLVTRSRSGGDPSGASTLIPYSEVQGTSGVNAGAFPSLEATGVTVGELEALYNQMGALGDKVDALTDAGRAGATPVPMPELGRTNNPSSYTTKEKQAIGRYITTRGTAEEKAALARAVGDEMKRRARQQADYTAAILKR